MTNIYGFTSPTAGRELIAGLLAGETLTITKVMVGTGKPENLDQMAALTNLISPMAYATSTTPVHSGSTVTMTIEYRSDLNGSLAAGFYLNEYGVFAKTETSEETLIYYGSLGDYPQWVNAYSPGQPPDIRRFPVTIVVADEVNVNVQYTADAFITAEEAAALLRSMVEQATAGSKLVEITIPAESWAQDTGAAYPWYADVTVEESRAGCFPAAALHTESLEAAAAAGMAPVVQALEGKVRFWAKKAPGSALDASLALLSGGKDSAGQGFGVVNVGTALQINVPGGVAGVGDDGKISEALIPEMGGGFVQMRSNIPVAQRKKDTLYSLIEVDFG